MLVPLTVHVVVPLPIDQTYTYLIPQDWHVAAQVGCRVLVPFGPRQLTGMIVARGTATEEETEKLKPLLDVLDEQPAFTDRMLQLTRWIADYYVCSWGEVIKAALPSGIDVESQQRIIRTSDTLNGWSNHATARAILRYLDSEPDVRLAALRKAITGVSTPLLRKLEADGLVRIETTLTKPKVRVKREKHVRLAPAFRTEASLHDLTSQLRGSKQIALLEGLAAHGFAEDVLVRQADLLKQAAAPSSTLTSLAKRGIVEVVDQEVFRSPLGDLSANLYSPAGHAPHKAQQKAIDRIGAAIADERFETFLLHGVTGSGKTEVYIQALKRVVARGKTGIVLVPEIALTPQTVKRFRSHFGDRIAVLHSRMSMGERYDAWRALRNGQFAIAIGPRSAVLAPLSNLGIIVVDEEHESSYKQFDPAPRYHARDVAVMRAHRNNAVCILGSATPSLETYVNARRGKYTLLSMPERVPVPGRKAASLPTITVVDLALEKKKHQLEGAISKPLRAAIQERLDRKEQIILLQNRRGYAPVLECQSCGFSPTCYDCSVTLTYHKPHRQLRCHYCGRTQRVPYACPKCSTKDWGLLGTGTQRVEEELESLYPNATILRMDMDTTSRKNAHHKLLDKFGRGDADILLGTQMVAKGLDFGRVTLVGVINADTGMLLPDFRSEERTFQLLTQVAGRAGRSKLRGDVILQTRNPKSTAIRYAVNHDYLGFIEAILPDRQTFGYPPLGRLVGVEFRGPNEHSVENVAKKWTAILRQHLPDVQVLGPEPAFVGRVKRLFRFHTLIKAPRTYAPKRLQQTLRATDQTFGKPPKGYRIAIDVDAIGLF